MNIAFWGEEHQSGTTAHMHAVMEILSVLCPQEKMTAGGPLHGGENEFHFYDCGSGLGGRKRHVLWQSDLVIVSLRREKRCVDRFFMYDFHIAKKFVYLLGGVYIRPADVDRRYLECVYRVEPEDIIEIPFCNGFYHALSCGRGEAFLHRELAMPKSGESAALLRELKRAAFLIRRYSDAAGDGSTERAKQIRKDQKAGSANDAGKGSEAKSTRRRDGRRGNGKETKTEKQGRQKGENIWNR
ncbi:MAG: hypothetical protein HFI35_12780 [Roseburia sp.]|jgi:hypothetical protein|nr:hypothetical protein [Roseburia sp.]